MSIQGILSKLLRVILLLSLISLSNFSYAKENGGDLDKPTKPISLTELEKQNKIGSFELKNGLQVYVMPDHTSSAVYYNMWYKVGAAEDPIGKTGLAYFLENLIDYRVIQNPKSTLREKLNSMKVSSKTETTWDTTCYRMFFNKEHLDTVLMLNAERFNLLDLTEDNIEQEKRVFLYKRKVAESPVTPLFTAANASFFWQHPYGKPVAGYEEDVNKYSLKDVQSFMNTWYAPNNAILVIGGDVSIPEAKQLVEKYYGKLEAKSMPTRERPREPTHPLVGTYMVWAKAGFNKLHFQNIYRTPEHKKGDTALRGSLVLLEDIMGNSSSGLLQNLVNDQSTMKDIAASYIALLDAYSFVIFGNYLDNKDNSLLPNPPGVMKNMNQFIKEGIVEEQLKNAKKNFIVTTQNQIQNLPLFMEMIGKYGSFGYSLQDIDSFFLAINNLSTSDVNTTLRSVISKGPELTIIAY